jgi:hypothetical protein
VDDAEDDANDVVEGDDNNGGNDAVNEWEDVVEDDKDVEDDE